MSAPHRHETTEQVPPHWGERLHLSDGETAWNDRHGAEWPEQPFRSRLQPVLSRSLRHAFNFLAQSDIGPAAVRSSH
jgi:hypothetical protein